MNRRSFVSRLSAAAILAAAWVPMGGTVAAADHPAITYAKKVADDLLAANRAGTITSFSRVLRRHADIPGISMYSLGNYRSRLPKSKSKRYFNGVTAFMARYFADQTRNYRVAKAEVLEASKGSDGEIVVNCLATLISGSKYRVQLVMRRAGSGYKITDVKVGVPVLGYVSLTYQQRGIFQKYLAKKGGDVNALVETLNR
jgi:ABC-type transporter MlaC component